jgi:hypothetical protein
MNLLSLIMFKTNQIKENMNIMQLEKKTRSNAQIDDLYRKIENNENQWFALDFILDHLNENQKVKSKKIYKRFNERRKNNAKIKLVIIKL